MSRLADEPNVWLATVRPDGRPHLVPIWFVWLRDRFWLCTTDDRSVKVRNIERNDRVTVSLENGNSPVVAEGRATVHRRPFPPDVAAAFAAKFQWDIDVDGEYEIVLEISVDRWLFGSPDS